MKDTVNTTAQQISDVEQLRQRIEELEKSNAEMQQAKEALRESEERLNNVIENVNEVIFQLSPIGVIDYISPRVKELYGYKPEELVGKHFKTTTPASEVPKALEVLKKALSGEIVKNFEIDQLDKNGKIVHMEISGTPVKRNGTVIAVQGFMRDITERKHAEDTLRETSLFLRNILDSSSSISIVFTDLDQNILFWNKGAENIFGYKTEEVVGRHTIDILYPDDEKDIKQTIKEIRSFILSEKRGIRRELKEVTKDGRTLWINLTSTPRIDENGNVMGILGIGEDITERKQAEEMLQKAHQELEKRVEERTAELSKTNMLLRQEITERKRAEEALSDSERRFKIIFDSQLSGIMIIDPHSHTIVDVNTYGARMIGLPRKDIIGKICHSFFCPAEKGQCPVSDLGQEIDKSERVLVQKEGNHIPILKSVTRTTINGSELFIESFQDITERNRMEEALRENAEKYRVITSTAMDGFAIADVDGRILDVNEESCRMLGYSRDEQLTMSIPDIEAVETPDEFKRHFQKVMEIGSDRFESLLRCKDGRIIDAEISLTFMPHSKHLLIFHRDITDRKKAVKKIRESEERYRAFYDDNPSMYFTLDPEGIVLSVNQFGAEQLGYTVKELVGQPVFNVFYKDDQETVKKQLTECIQHPSEVFHWECRKVRKNGNIVWVKETARTVRCAEGSLIILIVCEDITERKRADEKLKANFDTLSKNLESTVSALASALEMRDPYTAGHQQRVTDLACAIAEDMGLGIEQIAGIRMAGLIHDIGKINIPAEILNKPGQLTEIEYSLFKNHPQVGHDVLQTVEFPWPVAQIVLQHHERMDGSGYPQGLSGDEIMLEARILAVADIVEAIASHRPYRPARGIGDALEEILHNKSTLYDPEVVDACLRVFYERGFKFEHMLRVATPPKIH